MKNLILLGVEGCPTCAKLDANVQMASASLNFPVHVEKITNPKQIMEFNAGGLPAVIVDGTVKALRRVPTVEELVSWLQ